MMKSILDKIGVIIFNYSLLKRNELFNIFELLGNQHDEKKLHSRMIGELLNPKGSHNANDKYAKSFLSLIGRNDFLLNSFRVFREYKNIDILIVNETQAIIIENKIWASDQEKQLERYYHLIKDEGYEDVWIYYLTLKGNSPTEYSAGELIDKVETISYKYHINRWIETCICVSARNASLRETLIQYQKVINQLSGKNMFDEQTKDLIELLSQNENIINAKIIADNWNNIRYYIEYQFWSDLEKIISRKYIILEEKKYSADLIEKVINTSKNKNFDFGIMFEIGKTTKYDVCLFIVRGWESLYYGIILMQDSNICSNEIFGFKSFTDKIKEYCEWDTEEHWLGGCYLNPEIDFEKFNDDQTLKLINPHIRQNYIEKTWIAIEEFIANCNTALIEEN